MMKVVTSLVPDGGDLGGQSSGFFFFPPLSMVGWLVGGDRTCVWGWGICSTGTVRGGYHRGG
ncbi:hypothetical protein L873DRAFT_957168 [Choiromyces venosus 120613-1]|uniref:Uncharacterized protein n=1 Tax=Choiromyces venosus 120613-1 TaxID=1336337 RepID=A0A3N4K3T9_9PEZI|nr:hypothetical protein L873DRAFT_957168 [Choiromyces venosus 120613-1]